MQLSVHEDDSEKANNLEMFRVIITDEPTGALYFDPSYRDNQVKVKINKWFADEDGPAPHEYIQKLDRNVYEFEVNPGAMCVGCDVVASIEPNEGEELPVITSNLLIFTKSSDEI